MSSHLVYILLYYLTLHCILCFGWPAIVCGCREVRSDLSCLSSYSHELTLNQHLSLSSFPDAPDNHTDNSHNKDDSSNDEINVGKIRPTLLMIAIVMVVAVCLAGCAVSQHVTAVELAILGQRTTVFRHAL